MRRALIYEARDSAFSHGRRFGFAFGTSNNGDMAIEFVQVPSIEANSTVLGSGPLYYTQENNIENLAAICFQQFRL